MQKICQILKIFLLYVLYFVVWCGIIEVLIFLGRLQNNQYVNKKGKR